MKAIEKAGWALIITQVVHALTPADTEAEGYVGLVGGLALLIASMAGVYGVRTGKPWAAAVIGWAGAGVAVGFVLYHALPFHTPATNPYLGEAVGPAAWVSVALSVAAGAWAAYEGLVREGVTQPA